MIQPRSITLFSVVERNNRVLVENELVVENGQYQIDFGHLEEAFAAGARATDLLQPTQSGG